MQSNGGEGLVGVDVSKAWLDVCRSGARQVERIANTPEAVAVWIARTRPRLLAMEPTGGYERVLCLALAEAGVRYVKFHPNAILAFRKARGLRAKTDRIDAMLIAQYLAEAEARGDLPEAIPVDERLRALAARRRQLVDARQAECCRADLAADPLVRESLSGIIAALSESLNAIEEAIERRLARALRSVRGVGRVVAATLVADLPELGRLGGKQIAALVGLAPQTHQSGTRSRRAKTSHGRPIVRRALFNRPSGNPSSLGNARLLQPYRQDQWAPGKGRPDRSDAENPRHRQRRRSRPPARRTISSRLTPSTVDGRVKPVLASGLEALV